MILFLDTEFTQLLPGNKLISIALVDENENFFYAELTDTYKLSDCSDFVKDHVLPHLRGGEYRMKWNECCLEMCTWIEDKETECILGMDNPSWDFPHFKALTDVMWPLNLVHSRYMPVYTPGSIADDLIIQHNFSIHNALDDAMLMAKVTKLLAK